MEKHLRHSSATTALGGRDDQLLANLDLVGIVQLVSIRDLLATVRSMLLRQLFLRGLSYFHFVFTIQQIAHAYFCFVKLRLGVSHRHLQFSRWQGRYYR